MREINDIAVNIQNVSFAYLEHNRVKKPIYQNLSLSIESQQITALMGASGAGKSTLGKLLSGDLKPESGTIQWSEPFKTPKDRFYLDQDPSVVYSPWLTVEANVREPLKILGWSRIELVKWSNQIISKFELGTFTNKFPNHLSGGQKSRLALARVLAWMPKAIILDEYLADLDTLTRRRIMQILRDFIISNRMTIILISHSTSDVAMVADRCLMFGGNPAYVTADINVAELRTKSNILDVQSSLDAQFAKAQHLYD